MKVWPELLAAIAAIALAKSENMVADNSTIALPPVLYFAPFFSGGGYCSEASAILHSMVLGNISVQVLQHGDSLNQRYFSNIPFTDPVLTHAASHLLYRPEHSVVLCHSEPGAWYPAKWPTTLCPHPNAAYRIGRTMFETDRLPSGWAERMARMDEIWVPSQFNRDTFVAGGVDAAKVRVVPEPVDTNFFDPIIASDLHDGLISPIKNTKRFRFLSIFKWEPRKGWDILLRAYLTAFTPVDDVCLVIHTEPYHSNTPIADEIDRVAAEVLAESSNVEADTATASQRARPCIEVLTEHIPLRNMPALYAGAHCFVLPSRGEGWGRPHVEAMSMGLPVIATNWSGPTAFITPHNSYPLPIAPDLVPVGGTGPFRDHRWAEPSVDALRTLMRHVYEHTDEAAAVGKRAREDMVTRFSVAALAPVFRAELERIAAIMHTRKDIPHAHPLPPPPQQPQQQEQLQQSPMQQQQQPYIPPASAATTHRPPDPPDTLAVDPHGDL